jgi:hypothetical protein
MANPFLQFVKPEKEQNPFLQFATQEQSEEQPEERPEEQPLAATPEQPPASVVEAAPQEDFSGFFESTPMTENPFSTFAEAAKPTLAPPETTTAFKEAKKGVGSAVEGLKFMPEAIGLSRLANKIKAVDQYYPMYERIDAGEKITRAEATAAILDFAPIQRYQNASPEERLAMREKEQQYIVKNQQKIAEALPAFAEYQKRMEPYMARVPGASDISSLSDFKDWLAYNVSSGAVQLIPIMASAVVAGAPGALAVGTGMAMQEGVQNRLEFILDKVKSLSSEEQAQAVEDYLKATNDTTTMVAIGSGVLDLAGPVGTILRKQFAKELGKEAVKYETKAEAAKAGLKETPRELAEEGLTGGAQEALQITGEQVIGEQTGDVFSKDNVKRVFDSAAAEAAGSIAGSGINVGTNVGQQMIQKKAEELAVKEFERQLRQKIIADSADKIAPVFDKLVDQYKNQINPKTGNPYTEVEAFKLAGQALSKGVVDVTDTEAEPGAGESSISVLSGEGTVSEPAPGVEGIEPAGVAAVGDIFSSVGGTEGAGVPSLDAAIQARANELIAEAADLGATIPMDVAVERATTELTEEGGATVTPEVTPAPEELTSKFSPAYIEVGTLQKKLKELGNRYLELKTKINSYYGGDTLGRPTGPRKGSKRFNEAQALGEEASKTIAEYQETETAFKQARDAYMADPANQEEIARLRAEREAPAETAAATTPAETTTTTPAENIVETPATDPVGFARVQALTSFENRNSSDYSNPEEAIDFGLDNLNDTLTEYKVTDPYIREEAVEAYRNEIARLKKEAATVSVDQATTATPAETKLKPQGKPRGRKPVVRTPEEQAEAEAQRKQRQAIGRDAIREADKAQAVITREFNPDDYATDDAMKASALELLQERQGALVAAYNTMANKSLAPNSKAKQTAQAVINHESVTDKERRDAQARIAATEQTARSDLLKGAINRDLDATYLVEDFGTATKAIEYIIRTGSAFEKLLAQRIKPFLKGVKLVIVNNPERDIPNAKHRRKFLGQDGSGEGNATGLYAETAKGERIIYLSNVADFEGIDNMTFLHEAVHGATMAQIVAYIEDPNSVSPQARAAIKSMNDIMLKAYAYYAVLKAGGRSVPGINSFALDEMYKLKVFTDLKEFVAYGLTQPEMQQFLSAIPGNYDSSNKYGAFTKFVEAIRKIFNLGPQYKSAFIDLVTVTDQLLNARGPVPSKNTIIAAANKLKKQNKTLNKIYRSQSASKMASSLGQLVVETRNVKDALRLLKSAYSALSVRSIRLILPTLTTMDITRWIGDDITNIKTVNQTVTDMAGMRAKMIRELAEKTPEWIEFNRKYEKGGIALGDVMNASTLLSVDPSANPDVATTLQNDAQLKKLNTEYQAALNDPAKTPKQRSAAKAKITKRENEIKVVYEGGTVTNPDTGETYTVEGWDKLGKYGNGKGHEIYKMAKDTYENTFNQHLKLLTDKINNSNIPGTASNPNTPKGKLIAEITKNFQEAMKMGVYFPLMRYGNYWLRIGKGKSGEFHMFESATARNYYAEKRAEESGKTLDEMVESQDFDVGDDLRDLRQEFEDSSQMLKDIFKALEDSSQVDPNTGKAGISDVDALKDQVYQMYLMTLPERDIRRRFTHRQGKTGFSADVIRNFIVSQHTAANQLSRLAYSDKLRLAIGSSYAELAGNPDRLKLSAFVDEIAMRAAAEMNPPAPGEFNWDSVASVANQAVFYYMLTSPKSALVQMTQLPVVGLPVLSAEYGVGKATATALRYSNLFNKLGTTKKDANGDVITSWGEPSINDSGYVNKHPDPAYRATLKRAWEAAQDKDIFMSTYAADMTARAKVPTQRYQGGAMRVLRWTGNLMGGAFHHMERITREIMYMSSFELEYARQIEQGAKPADAEKAAVNKAVDLVYESLFNYSQYNKPRLMKAGPIYKIATQFMTYPLQMTSYLVRNFYGMLPFLNKSQKKEAAIQFFGTLGMTTMFAGVVGLPGYSMIMGMAEGVREALRPDMEDEDADEYYDEDDDSNPLGMRNLDLWFREWFIPHYFGKDSSLANAMGLTDEQALTLQRAVKMGPISAFTDLNIGSSVSLNELWFRDDVPAENSKEALEQFVFSTMTGPFGSMATSLTGGVEDILNGDLVRGFEKLSPAFFRGAFTTYRLSQEGLQTRQGAEIKNAEFYTTGKLIGQALGFQSTTIAEIQKSNFKAKQMVEEIKDERKDLLQKLDKAFQKFDNNPSDANDEAIDDIFVEIDRYNYKNGMIPITNETIERSLEGRAKRREMADYGLILGEKEAAFVYPMLEKTRPLQ